MQFVLEGNLPVVSGEGWNVAEGSRKSVPSITPRICGDSPD